MSSTREETFEAVVAVLVDALREAHEDSETPLGEEDSVTTIVRGDRVRPTPEPDAIWVIPRTATFAQDEYGAQGWVMPVDLAVLVQKDEPEEAGVLATRIASKALDIALGLRALLKEAGIDFIDVRPQAFDPTARPSERNSTLFWTYATVRFTFATAE